MGLHWSSSVQAEVNMSTHYRMFVLTVYSREGVVYLVEANYHVPSLTWQMIS